MKGIYVELVEDRLMFNLADLTFITALHEHERAGSRHPFQTRLGLRSRMGDLMLLTSYEQIRDQVVAALRAVNQPFGDEL